MNRFRLLVCAALLLPGGAANSQTGGAFAWDDGTVPFVVTPMEIVERMLRMAEVGKGDTVIDLGSGDGRTGLRRQGPPRIRSDSRDESSPGWAPFCLFFTASGARP